MYHCFVRQIASGSIFAKTGRIRVHRENARYQTDGSLALAPIYRERCDEGRSELPNIYPTEFEYIALDGTRFQFGIDGKPIKISDQNENSLTFTEEGIVHSTGEEVTFVRDSEDRIIQVIDPMGQAISYTYSPTADLTTVTDRVADRTSFFYDNKHNLTKIIDPRGIEVALNDYDASGRLTSTTDANGNSIEFDHNLVDRKETITDRLGNSTVYEYDNRGNVLRITDALGNQKTYTYDLFDNELTRTDELGQTTRLEYDDRDLLIKQTDPLGNITRFEHDAFGNITRTVDSLGNESKIELDQWGNILRSVDALGNEQRFEYHPNLVRDPFTGQGVEFPGRGPLKHQFDALGNSTFMTYNTTGTMRLREDQLGNQTFFQYNGVGNRVQESVSHSNGARITGFAFDPSGRLTVTTDPALNTTQVTYNDLGQEATRIDQLGRVTSFVYDDQGRQTSTRNPDASTEQTEYDLEGRRVASIDRAGRKTTFEYDVLGRLTKTNFPNLAFTTTEYDSAGKVRFRIDQEGNKTSFEYDSAGRTIASVDGDNRRTEYTNDSAGNQISVLDAEGNRTTFEYDSMNRRVKTIFDDGTFSSTAFDSLSRKVFELDQNGKRTKFEYDALGRITAVVDHNGERSTYTYDEVGNQLTQTDVENQITKFEYDNLGRRISRQKALQEIETFTYDAVGNMLANTDYDGHQTVMTYDNMNRSITETPDPSRAEATITRTYTVTGMLETENDASGVTTWQYDVMDRMIQKSNSISTINYTYDKNGNQLTAKTTELNGYDMTYTYDVVNRLVSAEDGATGITTYGFDAVGNLTSMNYPNNVNTSWTYSTLNRLTNVGVSGNGSLIASYTYTLDPVGNRLSVSELSGRTATYTYDNLYRLTSEQISNVAPLGVITYAYDKVGNRLRRTSTVAGVTNQTNTYNANNELGAHIFNNNGATIEADGNQFALDYKNRILSVNGGQIVLTYDGRGSRVSKKVGNTTIFFFTDENNPTGFSQVVEEYTQSGNSVPTLSTVYAYGLDLISKREIVTGDVKFYGMDGHGSVRFLTDNSGSITDRYDYDAFGILINQTGSSANNYLYAGEQFDPDLNLYYNRARYLDVDRSRFRSMDPFGGNFFEPITLHRYLYANGNPVGNIDPSGERTLVQLMAVVTIGAIVNIGLMPAALNSDEVGGVPVLTAEEVIVNIAIAEITGFLGGKLISAVGAKLVPRVKKLFSIRVPTALPFRQGEIIVKEFATSQGPVELAAEVVMENQTLWLKDVAIFPKGAEKLDIGIGQVLEIRSGLASEAAELGFSKLRITGTRVSGANIGKVVDVTIDLAG